MSSIAGASSATLMTTAGIEQLVRLSTARQQQTLIQYQTKLDDLEVKRGIYSDIQTRLTELRSAVEALRSDDGTSGVLNNYAATVSGDEDALSATVSSSNVAAGSYDVTIGKLATVDRYASCRFSDTETALGISGGAIGDNDLGFFDTTTEENGVTNRHLETAQNVEFTVNGLAISHSSNSISDVIDGVTLNLAAVSEEGSRWPKNYSRLKSARKTTRPTASRMTGKKRSLNHPKRRHQKFRPAIPLPSLRSARIPARCRYGSLTRRAGSWCAPFRRMSWPKRS
jgi:flagellar capping protein FliD